MSLILMTTLFYKALILQGEIWCWSLLGLKGLIMTGDNDGDDCGDNILMFIKWLL